MFIIMFKIEILCLLLFIEPNAFQNSCNPDCLLPKKVGMCRALILKYYYDTKLKKCTDFKYGGCRGNNNRFETIEGCEEHCKECKSENIENVKQ